MDTTAIAGQAMSMQAARLQQAVSMSVLKMSMDTAKQQGEAMTQLINSNAQAMERSVNPHLGTRLDVLG